MKKWLPVLVVFALGYAVMRFTGGPDPVPTVGPRPVTSAQQLTAADAGRVVESSGTVTRLLADDNDGSRHQRFILRLASGQTVLVAHNIDLAPRIPALAVGDAVDFRGEYVANPQGGVIHWTHRDPQGRHSGGWLRHAGREYR